MFETILYATKTHKKHKTLAGLHFVYIFIICAFFGLYEVETDHDQTGQCGDAGEQVKTGDSRDGHLARDDEDEHLDGGACFMKEK